MTVPVKLTEKGRVIETYDPAPLSRTPREGEGEGERGTESIETYDPGMSLSSSPTSAGS